MIHPKVGGRWLREVGSWGDVEFTTSLRGSDTAKWTMQSGTHPEVPRGSPVVLYKGATSLWAGTVTEPGTEEFNCAGLWAQAIGAMALDGSGLASWVPDTAIDAAISRGAVTWTRTSSLSTSAIPNDGKPISLATLLDTWADTTGVQWKVGPEGDVSSYTIGGPDWHVAPGVGRLSLADDSFATHLVGWYLVNTTPTYGVVTVGNAAAAAKWGRREEVVDLIPLGVISSGTATTTLTAMLANGAARLNYAEGLELGAGQLLNTGGGAAALEVVSAGQVVRIHGIGDETDSSLLTTYTDITLGTTRYVDGERTVSMTPRGMAPRDLKSVLTLAVTAVDGLDRVGSYPTS